MNKPIDISAVTLTTRRLTLRAWKEADLEDFYAYASVDGVGQMAGWLPHRSKEESREILSKFIQGKRTFALEHEGKVIGSLGVEFYREEAAPELERLQGRAMGYVLSKEYWGRGLMPEAVEAVLAYLFEEEKLDFVIISHYEWNNRSRRVIEKAGFRYVCNGTHATHYGTLEPTLDYILTREDWEKTVAQRAFVL